MIAIFDLDGTLALNEHRQHFLEEKPKNWKAFNAACGEDKPNWPVISILRNLARSSYATFILSGRSESVRAQTVEWLEKHKVHAGIDYGWLHMRQRNDFRDDREVKREMFACDLHEHKSFLYSAYSKTVLQKDKIIIFDDRQKVVDMWREMGLVCCQVAPGDF